MTTRVACPGVPGLVGSGVAVGASDGPAELAGCLERRRRGRRRRQLDRGGRRLDDGAGGRRIRVREESRREQHDAQRGQQRGQQACAGRVHRGGGSSGHGGRMVVEGGVPRLRLIGTGTLAADGREDGDRGGPRHGHRRRSGAAGRRGAAGTAPAAARDPGPGHARRRRPRPSRRPRPRGLAVGRSLAVHRGLAVGIVRSGALGVRLGVAVVRPRRRDPSRRRRRPRPRPGCSGWAGRHRSGPT